MAENLKKGDLVKLKGQEHDPIMVVVNEKADFGKTDCVWYNSSGREFKTYSFPSEALIKIGG
jgi:uncharacterized protein YodC (DUF2158 family)